MSPATLHKPTMQTALCSQQNSAHVCIHENEFKVEFLAEAHTVVFEGELQLCGKNAYAPVAALLETAIAQTPSNLCFDLRKLTFLNSSGIYMLLQAVLNVRNQKNLHLTILGSSATLWQQRSLRSLQQLMPSLDLRFAPDHD